MDSQEWGPEAEHPLAAPLCDAVQTALTTARKVLATGIIGILLLWVAVPFAHSTTLIRSGHC